MTQIKQTSKIIEVSMGEVNRPSFSPRNSNFFENETDEAKEDGINLFAQTLLQHKDFLGINRLYEKHELVKKKRENILKKKIEKKYKSMSTRRSSKFETAQVNTLFRSSFNKYLSNFRTKKPKNHKNETSSKTKIARKPFL